ncbi:hypothetical protein PMG11_09869 [Penicillium brasilianum]|uniref:Uncharacterized protein n=1 Tax=Penicillium brasilianum TaxID=104259 RepID=A0A0F7TXC2_PENBI|nr:hypothetical protein PMG11_09869 [Penicillium brasilianum]
MQPHESATPMGPPSTTVRQQSQKRPLDSSPVTPSKRRRILPFPSTGSQRTPASTQISITSTPLSGPRTRTELDRYHEDVKRDAHRIRVVKNQLDNLQPGVDADPRSSPETTSESASMTTKQAIKLLQKILKEDKLIKHLEAERREIDPKKRGPQRSDQDGVVKSSRNKEKTRRAKLSEDIRKARRRIGYTWARLREAQIVTEPDILPTTTSTFEEDTSSMPSPIGSMAVQAEAEGDTGEMAENSDSEPMLPAGRTVARSIMSPSVPPEPSQEVESRNVKEDKDISESPVANGNADTDSDKEQASVEKQVARELESLSKLAQDRPALLTAQKPNRRIARAPRRSIYTPDSGDDEDRPEARLHERTSTHTTTEAAAPSVSIPSDQAAEKTTHPISPNAGEIPGKTPLQKSEDDISDNEEVEDSSENEEEKGDVRIKVETDDDDSSDEGDSSNGTDSSDDEDESATSDAEVNVKAGEDEDDSESEKDDNEGSDVEIKVEVEDEEASESSEGLRGVQDDQDKEDTGNTGDMGPEQEGDHSQNVIPSGQPEPPASSRPSTGLFERMNGIQTSGSFEEMMAGLRQAAAERERQAALKDQASNSDSSDSSDDESMPDWSPEPDAKPYFA